MINPGIVFRFTTDRDVWLTGTMFLMWLGEQITERGLGNGISIIIFGGIAAGLPNGSLKQCAQIWPTTANSVGSARS